MSGRLIGAAVTAVVGLSVLGTACNGYGELPVLVRESAEMVVESQELFPAGVGTVQLRVDLPDDAAGPGLVVASPEIVAANAKALNWAYGPCTHPGAPSEALDPRSVRLCAAVQMTSGIPSAPKFFVHVLLEDRVQARRFSASAEVTP